MVHARPLSRVWRAPIIVALTTAPACRKDNPDWLGPPGADDNANADTSSDGGSDTSDGSPATTATTEPATSSTTATTEPATSSTTADNSCNNDNQCDGDQLCGPMGCQDGVEGDPCTSNKDCSDAAPICGPGTTCQDGSVGDACSNASDCGADAPNCVDDLCAA